MGKLPLPSVLLAKVQSLDNKLDDLRSRRDIKNCNILCFTESRLNDDTDNIELTGFSVNPQDKAATSSKTRGGGVCLFVNNSRCVMSNIKELLRYCSPEVEYLMISCRSHYIPRDISSILFGAIYLTPQTDAGTKTTVNELYKAISKHENAHPDAALLMAGDFNAGKLRFT